MAIKNKNIMMSLTESLNENKKQEIEKFKKLKEATEDNISYVRYLLDTAEDMDDVQQAIYQIDDGALEDEVQLMFDSCSEDDPLEEVISLVITTMEDNAEYDEEIDESIEMSGNNMTVGEFYQDSVDKLKANKLNKDMVEVYDINEDYQGPTWVIGSELTDAGKERFKDFLSLNIDKLIDDSDEYKIYVNTNGNINLIDDFLNAVSGNISESDYDEWFVDLDEEMNESDDNQKVILKGVECESYQFDELKNILDNSNVEYKVNKDEPDEEGYYIASFDIYGTEKDMRDVIEKLLNTGYWDDSSVDEWMSYTEKFNESMNEDVPMDEPSPEESEDDRKNTLIAKKDELEARLGEILQSIKDKQMDTEEFRKLSREAADLDSQIMDLDNQIRGVYECDKMNEAELFNMDEYKDLADEDDSVNIKELKMIQDYAVRKTKEIINYVYYYAPYSGIGDNILNDMLNVIKEYLPNMNESINESDEDVKKGIVDQLISTGMTKEQAEQTANGICNIFKNKVGSNQVVNEDDSSDNSLNNIVWDNIEDYDDSEKEEIRNILQNLDFEVAGVDGHSVSIKLKPNGMVFWIDYSNDGSDIVGDWNQYIFDTTNSEDRIRKAIQTSYYEDTGDTIALEPMESAGFEYLENKGIIKDTGKGYSFTDVNESAKPIKEAAITEKNLLKFQGNVYMFECKGNSDFSHIVGENYNEEENTLENVETYSNKEDADKDYLGRCEITTESSSIEDGLDESDDSSNKIRLLSRLISRYPDISEEDEDYLYTLSYQELRDEISNRGISLEDLDESVVASGMAKDGGKYKKIDLYVDGKYYASTNSYKTVKDAVNSLKSKKGFEGKSIKGNFSK